MSAEIQLSLFDLLFNIAKISKKNRENPDERFLRLHKIQKYLDQFAENFFIQLFEAFDLYIEYISEDTVSEVEKYFSKYAGKVPADVLGIFRETFEIVEDIDDDLYLEDPEIEELIHEAYFVFLPKLFRTILNDEGILAEQITNFVQVKVRMAGAIEKIEGSHLD